MKEGGRGGLSHHFSRGQNTKNPVSLTFFAPQPHGNACYAGYSTPSSPAESLFCSRFSFPFPFIGLYAAECFTADLAFSDAKFSVNINIAHLPGRFRSLSRDLLGSAKLRFIGWRHGHFHNHFRDV